MNDLFQEELEAAVVHIGPVSMVPLGRVAAPPQHESTSGCFYFWVDRDQSVERTQLVTTRCLVAGRTVEFVGIVQEVYRRSRQKDVGEEAARYDGRCGDCPPFASEGVTYAEVAILRTDPVAHTPPTEESEVYLASAQEAGRGYGLDRVRARLDVGLLRNGGTRFAGTAALDLDFLLGKNGGHLNVNGIAGVGTKSTLLLTINWLLLRAARRQQQDRPSAQGLLQFVPVIFNVKNYDLFFLDHWNVGFLAAEAQQRADWREMGVSDPAPFQRPSFFAPQLKGLSNAAPVGRLDHAVQPYSWSLTDVIEQRLFRFLFSEEDIDDANFGGLAGELEEFLTYESNNGPRLSRDVPQTFATLLDWFRANRTQQFGDFTSATKGKLLRRLKYIVQEGDGVLRRNEPKGAPLLIPRNGIDSPLVIDLYGLHRTPSLQRFVVAAILRQIIDRQSGDRIPGLHYLLTLDELNRFAPKGSSDSITQQIELVAAEGRSQGIILLGAQQQASLVKPRVIENAAIRVVGRSGALELGQEIWKFLGPSARSAAAQLQPDEKLLYQPSFREPMLAKIPFPPFALSQADAAGAPSAAAPAGTPDLDTF